MKVVILAGGKGTRLQEETRGRIPKPMVEVGGVPLLAHIAGMYAAQQHRLGSPSEFLIATGYLDHVISTWVSTDGRSFSELFGRMTPVFTGQETQTGGRLERVYEEHLKGERTFFATYGDGLSDLNLHALVDHHIRMRNLHDVLVTLTAVQPANRFGVLDLKDGLVQNFSEKPDSDQAWINGGFYVIESLLFESGLVLGDRSMFERDVLAVLAHQERLAAFQHPGFWQMCDTPRDLAFLQSLWDQGNAPWLRWLDEPERAPYGI